MDEQPTITAQKKVIEEIVIAEKKSQKLLFQDDYNYRGAKDLNSTRERENRSWKYDELDG